MNHFGNIINCPNYKNNKLNTNWSEFNKHKNHMNYGEKNFNEQCFKICATKDEEKNDINMYYNEYYCESCDDNSEENNYKRKMCKNLNKRNIKIDNEEIPEWYDEQQKSIGLDKLLNINWLDINSSKYWNNKNKGLTNYEIYNILKIHNIQISDKYLNTDNKLYDLESEKKYYLSMNLNDLFEELKIDNINESINEEDYIKMDISTAKNIIINKIIINKKYNFDLLRGDINKNRGDKVYCSDENKPNWLNKCDNNRYGSDSIIIEVLNDYIKNNLQDNTININNNNIFDIFDGDNSNNLSKSESKMLFNKVNKNINNITGIYSGINIDSEFEKCIHNKLNISQNDKIQIKLENMKNILELTDEDIQYIKIKLKKIIIIDSSENELSECFQYITLGEEICNIGVGNKFIQILNILLTIIGNNSLKIDSMNEDERKKLKEIIIELNPYLRKSISNIINISKEYEKKICKTPTNTTLNLENIYNELFYQDKNINIDLNPNIDWNIDYHFKSLIYEDDIIIFGKKIIIIGLFLWMIIQIGKLWISNRINKTE